jgi:hypothetical protein
MNPFSRSHHQQTTEAGEQHRIEAETGWGIQNFVCSIRCYRILEIMADNQTRHSLPARYPPTSATPSSISR